MTVLGLVAPALQACAPLPADALMDKPGQCQIRRVAEAVAAGRAVPLDTLGGLGNPPMLLTPEEIDATVACLDAALDAAIASAQDATIRATRGWLPVSTGYMASEHGIFLQVFTNVAAKDYALAERMAGRLPQGAAILKRSFRVAADGTATPGPVFVMERMAQGYDASTNDWRFAVTRPDGTRVGESGGENAPDVAYCAGCHRSARVQDFLFFVPPRHRVAN
ncbi:MAG: cytochrome P460 family protein [Proteobacteria bacterium]|nr:cytochrome P460 family protein [Pseudomonadota bacterium]